MRRRGEFPSVDELVVCTVTEVFDEGAFVSLEEYGGIKGMIHLREVASGWIRNIRDYVRENQRVVCKVLAVDPEKHVVDLSLRRVTEGERKKKLEEFEAEKRAEKILLLAAKKLRRKEETVYREIIPILLEKFGSLHLALTEVAAKGEECLINAGLKKGWAKMISQLVKGLTKPEVYEVSGYVSLTCPAPNGVEILRNAMLEAMKLTDEKVQFFFVGSPVYRVVATGSSYKEAEELMNKAVSLAIRRVEEAGGKGEFRRK